jgi:NADH:ubiquinone oxidoreductase subunit 3 (subunit A)
MSGFLLTPPVSFIIILAVSWLLSYASSLLSFKAKKTEGETKPYACGEDIYDNMVRPDYSQFFIFVFFFTLAHVATLIITTVPKGTIEMTLIAIAYLFSVLVALLILFRR